MEKKLGDIVYVNLDKAVEDTLQGVWDCGELNELTEENVRDCAYELCEMIVDNVNELSDEEFEELTEMFVNAIPYVEL